jgi:hypothetical protein
MRAIADIAQDVTTTGQDVVNLLGYVCPSVHVLAHDDSAFIVRTRSTTERHQDRFRRSSRREVPL